MDRLALVFIAILIFALGGPPTAAAQTNQSGQSSQEEQAAKPATPAPPAPAQTPAPNTSAANSPTAPAETKPKKTWTNEDLGSLREDSAISTFSSPKPSPAKPHQNLAPPQRDKGAKWYRAEIEKLQAQLPPLDDKISKLHDAIEGKQVDEVRHYTWSKADDWRDQLARLQKQREDIQTKISALQDEARHKGIPADQLR